MVGGGRRAHPGGMTSALKLVLTLLAAVVLAGCGGDDAEDAAQDAGAQADQIAQEIQQLGDEVGSTAQDIAGGGVDLDAQRDRLRDLEQQARDLADRASELPEDAPRRAELESAAEDVARSAEELATVEADQIESAVQDARDQLEDALSP